MSLLISFFYILACLTLGLGCYYSFNNLKPNLISNEKKSNIIIISIFLLCICSYFIAITLDETNQILLSKNESLEDFSKIGPYGDLIGGIMNPVIAFIGIIAASLAFYAQYKANQQVQDHFKIQQVKEYKQGFENTFFNLLSIHHQIVSSIDFNAKQIFHYSPGIKDIITKDNIIIQEYRDEILNESELKSRDVFKFAYKVIEYLLFIDIEIYAEKLDKDKKESIDRFNKYFQIEHKLHYKDFIETTRMIDIYSKIYYELRTDFGHYFRNLYRLIKMIDESSFSSDEVTDFKIKYSYTSIIRAQLSDDEIKLMFFNCLTDLGCRKFKPLLEKYTMLKIIPLKDDRDAVFYKYCKLYDYSAFHNTIVDSEILINLKKMNLPDDYKILQLKKD